MSEPEAPTTQPGPLPEPKPEAAPEEEKPKYRPESAFSKLVAKTPWWLISIGVHALILLVLSFVVVLARDVPDAAAVTVSPPRKPREMPEMEVPEDLDKSKKILDMEKSVEDPIYRKNAEESDHNETADDEEFQKAKGDSLDYVSDRPFKGKGTFDVIGGGGGGGGRYGGRLGGKRDLVARGGGGKETEDAVLAALKWLARHQNDDGSWSAKQFIDRCGRTLPNGKQYKLGPCKPNPGPEHEYDAGVTGLSLLAFLGAGYSHLSKDEHDGICFGQVVRNGLQWLMDHQDAEGCFGPREGHYMYNHLVCALAFTEAYGLTGSTLMKGPAAAGVRFALASQNPKRAWRYTFRSGDNDTSVTGWAVMVLKSAELSGLEFPETAYDGVREWLDFCTDRDYYHVGYDGKNKNMDHFHYRRSMTAVGVMCRIFMDKAKSDPRVRGGCRIMLQRLPPRWEKHHVDFYYWYYGSLAFFQYDGPSGQYWKKWNEGMKGALLPHQNGAGTGCRYGSWEPVGAWCGVGGRVYSTAINCLTLEVYYRYANVFGAK